MRLFKVLITLALFCVGIGLSAMPSQAVEEETLEDIESNYSYTLSESDDAVIKLDPLDFEGREVDAELLSAPRPRTDIDFVNLESDRYEDSRGVEIIELSIPVE
ncbi:hypothetical protein S7335_2651 [Synechococcus sp. PCC 7335]|uniref:hypothetical protein n=1 Tax=Synechococcus sp. (strain ATCC 29403 / PCC 7335) TaxID=91464 RepID=UPI00017EE08D|nr:hypothetical protein [Synechococcus sp. PCC 7335]EDX84952.1 hypothetical protein S7335_2651 [Synechococcus sp. PCC 7335]